MDFVIGDLVLGSGSYDPGPKNAEWKLVNNIEIKEIPGRGKKFITVRTSDKRTANTGPLWECTLTVRSITDNRYQQLRAKCEDGGPFLVISNHGTLNMYIEEGDVTHGESDKEPPLCEYDDDGNEGPQSNHLVHKATGSSRW